MSQCPGVLDRREETGEASDDEAFTLADMTRAINTSEPTSPGIDRICYVRLKHLEEGALSKLLQLYTNIWKEGRLASAWKERGSSDSWKKTWRGSFTALHQLHTNSTNITCV